jgi:hypothetical protein
MQLISSSINVVLTILLLCWCGLAVADEHDKVQPAPAEPQSAALQEAGSLLEPMSANASPVLVAEDEPVLTTLTALTDISSGVCSVVSDFLLDYCVQYPDDQSCRTP